MTTTLSQIDQEQAIAIGDQQQTPATSPPQPPVLKKFDIREFVDRLTPIEGKKNQYHCPICQEKLTISSENGAYKCWVTGCASADIREAIAPLSQKKGDRFAPILPPVEKKKKKFVKAPIPQGELNLIRLSAPATDSPQPYTRADEEHGEVSETIYYYSEDQWTVRIQWKDADKTKGYDKTFRVWHRNEEGKAICQKGDSPWMPYRLDEASDAAKVTPNLRVLLAQEGEGCVEALRAIGLASITFPGWSWENGLEDMVKPVKPHTDCLVFLKDNDEPGTIKAQKLSDVCAKAGLPFLIVDPLSIHPELPSKADGVDILRAMEPEEFIRRLEEQIHLAVEQRRPQKVEPQVNEWALSDSSLSPTSDDPLLMPDSLSDSPLNLNPNEEITQQVLNFFYQDKPWICLNKKLYEWNETHYELRDDVTELRRISDFCNIYAVETKNGNKYPYANAGKVRGVLDWVKIRLGVDPSLVNPPGLNCTNGVLEIYWEGATPKWELLPHDPEKYYIYPPIATYDPDADSQHCDRLLAILDEPQREIFLRTIAACLDLPTVRKHKGRLVRCLLLKGHGSNGKDVAKEITSAMLGYQGISSATISDFAAYDSGRKFPIAGTELALVNWSSENANFAQLDKVQSLKAFITGDTLSAERKGRDEREFTPRAVALFNCNDTPNLQGSLEAITGRYGVLTFNKTFKIGADPSKGELEADPRFKYDREFLQKEVLPAFVNKVLAALVALMSEGIDYSCTQKALEEIQAENSHLFQFCQDTGLGYDPEGILKVGDIWERLKHWYEENGTLAYSDSNKPIWTDQAKRSDGNVKGMNQVLKRFLELFPKAKRITVGKGNVGIQGIGFSKISSDGEAVGGSVGGSVGAVVRQLAGQQPLLHKDGEAVGAVSLPQEKNEEMENRISFRCNENSDPDSISNQVQNLPRLPHHPDTVRDTASPTAPLTASPDTSTASPAGSPLQADLVDLEIIREWQRKLVAASVEEILPLMNSFFLSFSDKYSSEEIEQIRRRVWWGLDKEVRAAIASKKEAAENVIEKARREEELLLLEKERKQRLFPKPKFNPGEQVVFSEDKSVVYTVVGSTHTHAQLKGIDGAVADFLLERLE